MLSEKTIWHIAPSRRRNITSSLVLESKVYYSVSSATESNDQIITIKPVYWLDQLAYKPSYIFLQSFTFTFVYLPRQNKYYTNHNKGTDNIKAR